MYDILQENKRHEKDVRIQKWKGLLVNSTLDEDGLTSRNTSKRRKKSIRKGTKKKWKHKSSMSSESSNSQWHRLVQQSPLKNQILWPKNRRRCGGRVAGHKDPEEQDICPHRCRFSPSSSGVIPHTLGCLSFLTANWGWWLIPGRWASSLSSSLLVTWDRVLWKSFCRKVGWRTWEVLMSTATTFALCDGATHFPWTSS
jgi:hypothetical protein